MPITVNFKKSNLIKQGVINVSFPVSASWETFSILNRGCFGSGEPLKNSEVSVVLYCMFKAIEAKLSATPLESNKSKYTLSRCCYQDGHFIMTFVTQATFSAVRKVATIVAKSLSPDKCGPQFRMYAGMLGIKGASASYGWASDQVASGLNNVAFFATGKVTMKADKVAVLSQSIKKKIVAVKKLGGKVPEGHAGRPTAGESLAPTIKCSGLGKFLVHSYLKTAKIDSVARDGGMMAIVPNWETVQKKMKVAATVKKFIQQKFTKLGPKLGDALLAAASVSGYMTAKQLATIPANPTETVLVKTLQAAL